MKRPKGFRYAPEPAQPQPGSVPDVEERIQSVVPAEAEPQVPVVGPTDEDSAETVQLAGPGETAFDDFGELPQADGISEDLPGEVLSGDDEQATVDLTPVRRTSIAGVASKSVAMLHDRREADAEYRQAKKEVRAAERGRKRRERGERLRFSKHQRQRRRQQLIALSAVSVLVLSVLVGVFTPLMAVRTIEVRGAERVPVETITEALDELRGVPLALVTDASVREKLSGLSLLQTFEVEKVPPNTLKVVVHERVPVVAVPKGEELTLVDASGVTIDVVAQAERPEGIPVVRGVTTDFTTDEYVAMATVMTAMPEATRNRVAEMSAGTPQQVQLVIGGGVPVIWGDATQNVRKATVLEAMLTALDGVALSSIDVSSPDAPVYVPAG